ncbi:MAG: C25 family cysteine peptidase, partial [Planctomycetota bacterium]
GVDEAEKVRNFIKDAYSTWNIDYVLLGGDTNVVPHRYVYAPVPGAPQPIPMTDYVPSDLYFACLDGSWNSDGDQYWGEPNDGFSGGEIDLTAAVYVGRASVDNATQVSNFVNKTIQYETTTPYNAQQAVLIGEDLSPIPANGSDSLQPIRNEVMPNDYTYRTLYAEQGTFSRSNVIARLNESPHVVNHLGHGSPDYAMGLGPGDVDGLTNAYPFFAYSQTCLAGAFDTPYGDCMAEHFAYADNAAFAVVMNSRFGLGAQDAIGPSHHFSHQFFEALYAAPVGQDPNPAHFNNHLGATNQLSKELNLSRVESWGNFRPHRYVYLELNLHGDPETALRQPGNAPPNSLSIEDLVIDPEGDSGDTEWRFRVNLSSPSSQLVTVQYITEQGTATAGQDYVHASGTIQFAPGETQKFITVTVKGDTLDEGDETFKVRLQNATNATIADAEAVGTIRDDDDDGGGGQTRRYESANVPKGIYDSTTTTSTLTVTESGVISDLDVELDITHTWDSDLAAYLVAPNGTRLKLFVGVGFPGQDFTGTVLDDEAATAIAVGTAPFTGRFRPQDPLSVLNGMDAQGTWTLEITDMWPADQGSLNRWALVVETDQPPPPPGDDQAPTASVSVSDVTTGGGSNHTFTVRYSDNMAVDVSDLDDQDILVFEPIGDGWSPGAFAEFIGVDNNTDGTPRTATYRINAPGGSWDSADNGRYTVYSAADVTDTSENSVAVGVLGTFDVRIQDAEPLGPITFRELNGLDPSTGDLWYSCETTRPGLLTLAAVFQGPTDSVLLTLYDQNDNELAVSSPMNGNQRIDWASGVQETYKFKLSGSNSDVDLRLANLVRHEGNSVSVHGTDQNDTLEVSIGSPNVVVINNLRYGFEVLSELSFSGEGGSDTAVLHPSDGNDAATLHPGRGTLTGPGYEIVLTDVATITVNGGGGTDVARLYDDPGGLDTFVATPDAGTLSGNGFSNRVESFRYVFALATAGGNDEAFLYDDPNTVDRFKAWPEKAELYGNGFYNSAKSFRYVHADATEGGGDVAQLYDDPTQQDTFEAWPDRAILEGPGHYYRANAFRYVHAFATAGGTDIARLHDDPTQQDTFKARPEWVKLYGSGYYHRAKAFRYVYAYGSRSGNDVAILRDTVLTDYLNAADNWAEMFDGAVNYYFRTQDFDYVKAVSTTTTGDIKTVAAVDYVLNLRGYWQNP